MYRWVMDPGAPDPIAMMEILGFPDAVEAVPITGGADAAIWRVEYESGTFALRVLRPDQEATARREIAAMTAAATAGLPVPRVLARSVWCGRPALALSWMPGRPLRDELRDRPWAAWSLGLGFGRAQASLHAVPAPDLLRDHPVSWIAWAEPDDDLRSHLEALAGDRAALLHLDYHPSNVLVADGQVTAILDWANTRAGDPRADLARTAAILRFAPIAAVLPLPLAAVVRRAFVAGWRRGYRDAAGPVTGMAAFYAWAGLVMVRDLAPRVGRLDLPWLTPTLLAEIGSWAEHWRIAAGLRNAGGSAPSSHRL
jgi:aminoglycoside phosphotransferase (APT) family kinase protein